jgi:hypothetical protein
MTHARPEDARSMQPKHTVYALSGVWLLLFVISFVTLQVVQPTGDGFTRGLNRIVAFLSWQGAAFVVAMVLAWLTRRAAERGVDRIKLVGYLPLAASVFIVASFIAIVGYRVFIVPLLA